jgi:phosphoserine phosphatase RsbU/P
LKQGPNPPFSVPECVHHAVVADDDPIQADFVALVLARMGIRTTVVHDGPSALEVLMVLPASLFVCDIEMPGMDGIEVASRVREMVTTRYVFILLITARNVGSDYSQGLSAGADDFMNKPISADILTVRIRAAQRLLTYQAELSARTEALLLAQKRLDEDLAAAGATQRSVLPSRSLVTSAYAVSSAFVPSQHVSGDMFGYFEFEDGKVGFFLIDVAGHGVRAALLAASLGHMISKDYFCEAACMLSGAPSPAELISRLNLHFVSPAHEERYFTMICGALDPLRHQLTISIAGHPPPLLIHSEGRAEWVEHGSFPVGLFGDAKFFNLTLPFSRGDRLCVYSDGVSDAINLEGEVFGEYKITSVLENYQTSTKNIAELIIEELNTWVTEADLLDDVSVIVLEGGMRGA